MATVGTRLLTADEFYEWANRPDNRGRHFELERGEVVEIPPPGKYHGFVCSAVSRILGVFGVQRKKGYPCSNDAGMIVEKGPDTVRGPDVSFYEDDQTAENMERKLFAMRGAARLVGGSGGSYRHGLPTRQGILRG
jgi:Uma2 family endonuclease